MNESEGWDWPGYVIDSPCRKTGGSLHFFGFGVEWYNEQANLCDKQKAGD